MYGIYIYCVYIYIYIYVWYIYIHTYIQLFPNISRIDIISSFAHTVIELSAGWKMVSDLPWGANSFMPSLAASMISPWYPHGFPQYSHHES